MKKPKWSLITSLFTSSAIIFYLLVGNNLTSLAITDTFFLVSLFFLIVGIAFWIMSSGFFDNFQRFMKLYFHFRKKNEPKEGIPLSEIGKAHQRFWLETGGTLLIVAIVSLLFYFL